MRTNSRLVLADKWKMPEGCCGVSVHFSVRDGPRPFQGNYYLEGRSNKIPLFRTAKKRKRESSERGLNGNDLPRIVKRRPANAGLPSGAFCCHSFRVTTAMNLLKQQVPQEQVQYLLGHSDARTTDLYDRSEKEVTRNIVELISREI